MTSWDAIGEAARGRFVRWDAALWRELGEGPFAALSRALGEADPSVQAYAKLAAEAVGHGYLFPERSGARSFFNYAWQSLLPESLPSLSPGERASAIAVCWNLGENLEASPTWLKRLFEARLAGVTLAGLEARVRETSELLLAKTESSLGERWRLEWLHLGAHDPLFLPGAVCFLSPAVACVRSRAGDRALAVLCAGRPEVLGPVEWPTSPIRNLPSDEQLARLREMDRRVTAIHDAALDGGRLVATLVTSQYVLVCAPSEVTAAAGGDAAAEARSAARGAEPKRSRERAR